MNVSSWIADSYQQALSKHIVIVVLALAVNFVNGMLVVTFFSHPMFSRDARYILYIHLVINDMLLICFSVTVYVLTYTALAVNASLCYMLVMLCKINFMITPLNLAAMAIERFIAICKPLHHIQICTPERTHILIGLLWFLGSVHALVDFTITVLTQPLSFFRSLIPCYPDYVHPSKAHEGHKTASQVLYMSLVWITLIYTYCRVLFAARKALAKGSVNKARSTILLHCVQLLLCMLSYITPFMFTFITPFFPQQRTNIGFTLHVITNITPRLLSPLIYGARDQKFVRRMKELFICKIVFVKILPS